MKNTEFNFRHTFVLCSVAAALCVAGCASSPSEKQAAAPAATTGMALHKDKDIQGVWLADGFNFKGYDVLYIGPTAFQATERPNEVNERTTAMRVLPMEMTDALQQAAVIPVVTTREDDIKPNAKALRLSNTIIEYQKGGGGARYFAGAFGAGQPVIKVRGEFRDGDKLVCVFEMRRSGESGGARMAGAYMSDVDIQRNDIRDLAVDFADFVRRTAAK